MPWAHRIYRGVMRALLPVWLAALWWRGRKQPAYRLHWRQHLGMIEPLQSSLGGVLLHAASVGEMQAAQPLIKALMARLPPGALTVSCTTPTGSDTFTAFDLKGVRQVCWPFDSRGAVERFLGRLQPRLVILMEREIWPEMMLQCRERAVDVAVINARLSERSQASYQKLRSLMSPIWSQLAVVAAADQVSAQRYLALGVPPGRLCVTGNIKFDAPPALIYKPPAGLPPLPDLAQFQVLVAGSTHELEEQALLDAWPAFRQAHPRALLVLVPRHPQRFEAVAKSLEHRQLPFVRRSLGQAPRAHTQVLLADTMGELPAWYREASVCFIGGSLAPIGGHNPLEALCLGKPVLFGPNTLNFEALYQEVAQSQAGYRVQSGADILSRAAQWLRQGADYTQMCEAASALFARNQGACERSLAALQALLPPLAWVEKKLEAVQIDGSTIWWDNTCFDRLGIEHFQPQHWHGQALSTGSGRGQVHRFEHQGQRYLLRHYKRGGLVAKISQDAFWRAAPEQSRAMQELILLRTLQAYKLPVPRAVAAHHQQGLLSYRADIIVQWIEGSRNLVDTLGERTLSRQEWMNVGAAIAQLHAHRVYHADLNAHNLLIDEAGKVWVVDFDKCGFRSGDDWKAANLQRLLRSLRKEAGRHATFHWHPDQWRDLLAGYPSKLISDQAWF